MWDLYIAKQVTTIYYLSLLLSWEITSVSLRFQLLTEVGCYWSNKYWRLTIPQAHYIGLSWSGKQKLYVSMFYYIYIYVERERENCALKKAKQIKPRWRAIQKNALLNSAYMWLCRFNMRCVFIVTIKNYNNNGPVSDDWSNRAIWKRGYDRNAL